MATHKWPSLGGHSPRSKTSTSRRVDLPLSLFHWGSGPNKVKKPCGRLNKKGGLVTREGNERTGGADRDANTHLGIETEESGSSEKAGDVGGGEGTGIGPRGGETCIKQKGGEFTVIILGMQSVVGGVP